MYIESKLLVLIFRFLFYFFLGFNFCHKAFKVDDEPLVFTSTNLFFIVKCFSFENESSSIDFDFDVELVNDSHFESNIGTISSLEGHKKYDVKVLQDGERSYSYVKMYGVKTDDSDLELLGTTTIKRGAKKSFTSEEGTIVNLASKGKCQVSPILKIDENDIKASHSAKLGKVSEDVLFYMIDRKSVV